MVNFFFANLLHPSQAIIFLGRIFLLSVRLSDVLERDDISLPILPQLSLSSLVRGTVLRSKSRAIRIKCPQTSRERYVSLQLYDLTEIVPNVVVDMLHIGRQPKFITKVTKFIPSEDGKITHLVTRDCIKLPIQKKGIW